MHFFFSKNHFNSTRSVSSLWPKGGIQTPHCSCSQNTSCDRGTEWTPRVPLWQGRLRIRGCHWSTSGHYCGMVWSLVQECPHAVCVAKGKQNKTKTEGEIKTFPEKQKMREFITTRLNFASFIHKFNTHGVSSCYMLSTLLGMRSPQGKPGICPPGSDWLVGKINGQENECHTRKWRQSTPPEESHKDSDKKVWRKKECLKRHKLS